MLTRVSAEFENIDMAELAARRLKESVSGVLRTGCLYDRRAERSKIYDNKSHYTLLPMALTTFNYYTAVVEYRVSESFGKEPYQNRKTQLYVVCEENSAANVKSLLNALGGLNIRIK